jgi:hypothetical protein
MGLKSVGSTTELHDHQFYADRVPDRRGHFPQVITTAPQKRQSFQSWNRLWHVGQYSRTRITIQVSEYSNSVTQVLDYPTSDVELSRSRFSQERVRSMRAKPAARRSRTARNRPESVALALAVANELPDLKLA